MTGAGLFLAGAVATGAPLAAALTLTIRARRRDREAFARSLGLFGFVIRNDRSNP